MTWYDDTNDSRDPGGSDAWPSDALDRLIADAARDYHAPPPTVPRDAMWAAITAARTPTAAAPATPDVTTPVVSLADVRAERAARAERDARRRGLWAVAAAAAIFLATGVGVGHWWGRHEVASAPTAGPNRVAVTTPATPATPSAQPAPATTDTTTAAPNGSSDVAPTTTLVPERTDRAAEGARRAARLSPRASNAAYDVAVLRHFAQAEALLVSYRADTVDAAMDARLAKWARPLLGDTRLLLDSPAASDPRRRRLLEDLELVLAEVARLATPPSDSASLGTAGTAQARTERQLIDGTLRRAQLLPRLRTLVPAGT